MKKTTATIATIIFITFLSLLECESRERKEEDAKDKALNKQQSLYSIEYQMKKDAQKSTNIDEWRAYKTASFEKIDANNKKMADLKLKMQISDPKSDSIYEININELMLKNNELIAEISNYVIN